MPFTPFHLGPSSWIGLLLFKKLDFSTLLIASVIVDIEPFFVLFLNMPYPLHGFLHTFLGSSILAILTAIICYLLKNPIQEIMKIFKLSQNSSFKKIFSTSFFGIYFHILLDAFFYEEMNPFYPFLGNPFFVLFSSNQVYLFCIFSFLIGIALYLIFLLRLTIEKKALIY
ncbi:MAG: hypothetical protein QXY18_01750 [Nitrososphaerota archaeon]